MRTLGNIQHSSEDLVEIQKDDAIILDHCVSQLPEANFSTLAKIDWQKIAICKFQKFKKKKIPLNGNFSSFSLFSNIGDEKLLEEVQVAKIVQYRIHSREF